MELEHIDIINKLFIIPPSLSAPTPYSTFLSKGYFFLDSDYFFVIIFVMNDVEIDSNILSKEQQNLISDNYNLLKQFYHDEIKKGYIPENQENNFYSQLHRKFCYSALKFDPESGFQFSTYAYNGFIFCIEYIKKSIIKDKIEINVGDFRNLSKFRHINFEKATSSLNRCILWDSISGNSSDEDLDREKIINAIKNIPLDDKEREMIDLYFFRNLSFPQIGKIIGLKRERTRQIFIKIMDKIKKYFEEEKYEIEDFYK